MKQLPKNYETLKKRILRELSEENNLAELSQIEFVKRHHGVDFLDQMPEQRKEELKKMVSKWLERQSEEKPGTAASILQNVCYFPPYSRGGLDNRHAALLYSEVGTPPASIYDTLWARPYPGRGELSLSTINGQVANILYHVSDANGPFLSNISCTWLAQEIPVPSDAEWAHVTVTIENPGNDGGRVFHFRDQPSDGNSNFMGVHGLLRLHLSTFRPGDADAARTAIKQHTFLSQTRMNGVSSPEVYEANFELSYSIRIDPGVDQLRVMVNPYLETSLGADFEHTANKLQYAMIDLRATSDTNLTLPALGGGTGGPGGMIVKSICCQITTDSIVPHTD